MARVTKLSEWEAGRIRQLENTVYSLQMKIRNLVQQLDDCKKAGSAVVRVTVPLPSEHLHPEIAERDDRIAELAARVLELEADLAAERSGAATRRRRAARREAILGTEPRHTRFARAVTAAVKRDKEWGLDRSTYYDFVSSPCLYCGSSTGDNIGLDRIDNRGGYTKDNVVPCCGACNYRRGLMAYEKFLTLCGKVSESSG